MKKTFPRIFGFLLFALSHQVALSQYCSAPSTCSVPIQNVTLNGFSMNISNASGCTGGGYSDYTAMKADIRTGSNYTLTVVTNSGGTVSSNFYVYIDWNQDFIFDNSEQVYTGAVYNPLGTFTSTAVITVPANAALGDTRMRLRTSGATNVNANVACGSQTSGEAEDYTVTILPAAPPNCAGTFSPANNASQICTNTTLSWQPSGTGSQPSGYKVYLGTTTNPPLVSDQTTTTYNATGLNYNTLYYWKVISYNSTGEATGCTENTFTTTNLSASITPPTASVCPNTDLPLTGNPTLGTAPYTHLWTESGGTNLSTTNTQNTVFNSSLDGTFEAIYKVTDANGCTNADTISITVNPADAYDLSINITAGNDTICAGENVAFGATLTTSGANPSYNWQVNGATVSTTPTFSTASLNDQDVVSLVLTPDLTCPKTPTKTSNAISMKVNPILTTGLDISLTTGVNPGCSGQFMEFTATPTNGGTAPTYVWKVNGTTAGSGPTFNSSSLNDQDELVVEMTNNALCPDQLLTPSTPYLIEITPTETADVSISISNGSNPSCDGTSIEFTANPTFGGANPNFEWFVNGISTGSTGITYTNSNLVDQDEVSVMLTSDYPCPASPTATSVPLAITITPTDITDLQISIQQGSNSICDGDQVTFEATSTNGGPTPSFEWQVNGTPVATGSTFTSSTLVDGDQVQAFMVSSAACPDVPSRASNLITMEVNPILTTAVDIALTNGSNPTCVGETLEFTATPTNGGSAPTYEWFINGNSVATGAVFTNSNYFNQDVVHAVMVSNAVCPDLSATTSSSITITTLQYENATVSASITNGTNPSCEATPIEFTATSMNGGSNPSYDWKVNGSSVGSSPVYASSSLSDQDVVTVTMTSSLQCAFDPVVSSQPITLTIYPTDVTNLQIVIQQGSANICAGDTVAFALNATNGGVAPNLEWRLNGNFVLNGNFYVTDSLQNGDLVQAFMQSTANCPDMPETASNVISMQVNPVAYPSVSIALTGGTNPSCPGENLQFTATAVDGGSNPSFTWRRNGAPIASGPSLSSTVFTDQDVVDVKMVSSAVCAVGQTQFSNSITVERTASLPSNVQIAITQGANPSCDGETIQFTATPTNAGANPAFQWKLNGVVVASGSVYTTSTLQNGDVVMAVMTNDAACPDVPTRNSNSITMSFLPNIAPTVNIAITQGSNPNCAGEAVVMELNATNAGSNPSYKWFLNNNFVATGPIYGSSGFQNQDQVKAVVISSEACVSSSTDTSNVVTFQTVQPVPTAVSIAVMDSTYCEGTNIEFFVSNQQNQGTNPNYIWYVNGQAAATGSTYSPDSLLTGDVVFVDMLSSEFCVTNDSVSSNSYVVDNVQRVDAQITVSLTQGQTTSCEGTLIEFTAQTLNEGTSPMIQWWLNGAPAATGISFSSASFSNGDEIFATLYSNAFCLNDSTVYSDSTQLTINATTNPSISTELTDGSLSICAGEQVGFKASSTDGGSGPMYTWYLNGVAVLTDSIYGSNSFSDQDEIWCVLTSNALCANNTTDTSVVYTMNVTAIAPAPEISVSITAGALEICEGEYVGFMASSLNSGSNPQYEWFVNGVSMATVSQFGSAAFADQDTILCVLTTDVQCAVSNTDSSNVLTMLVHPIPPKPTISRSGTTLMSSSTTNNQWLRNGVDIPGATNQTYTYAQNGFYAVRILDVCPPDTSDLWDVRDVGIRELEVLNAKLYPNPTQGIVTLELAQETKGRIRLFDAYGKQLLEQELQGILTKISMEELGAGWYRMILETEEGSFSKNIVRY